MGTQPLHAVHRTVLVVDVSAYSGRPRVPQEEIRRGLYAALERAFVDNGLDWSAVDHEDRGDGVLVLVPPDVPKSRVVDGVPHTLLGQLRRYNATRNEDARIRLRVAITAGEVQYDPEGVIGDDVTLAFRLLDSTPLRDALDRSTAVFALIVSDRIYTDVVRPDPALDPDSFRSVRVDVKEVHGHAWLHVPNGATPLPEPEPARPRPPRPPWQPPWARLGLAVLLLLSGAANAFAATPLAVPPCPAPVQLNVLTSAEKEEVVNRQAVDFERASRRFNPHGCKGVSVLVTRGTSAKDAAEALARGWAADEDFTGQGTEPHVWLPDASFEVDAVTDALSRNPNVAVRLDHRHSLARSPIVLGASPALAERIDQPDREFNWREVGQVAAVDTSSGAGLGAAIALAREALKGLAVDAPDAPLRLHKAAVKMTTATPCAGDVALVASEKTVVQREKDCVLLYPQGPSVVLDHPFVAVEWTSLPPNERRQRVVDLFEAHLRADPAQSAFRRAGFRDLNGGLGSRGKPRAGLPADPVVVDDATAVRAAWDAAAGPRTIALASDGSAGAEQLAADLRGLLGPHDGVTRVPLTGDVLQEAVRRKADVVVLLAAGAIGPVDPDAGGPVRAVGVGFADGACATSTALFKAADARGGACYETDGPEGPQRALEGVAKSIWGR
ncbi:MULTISPECIES: substrate-binding domain-containing protein [Saccharothrix]|uniref:substrate-binding domain-containing protein n=1 Tax=Saccharothrix TaxID=2071 RepID=UPI00093C270F|nr:substrate-binding domain-containing protein [Saccharothrix sp. CB00851]OKI37877.1 hypothetical protein A6A25_17210 [Saccharothrix sp. CB00851]